MHGVLIAGSIRASGGCPSAKIPNPTTSQQRLAQHKQHSRMRILPVSVHHQSAVVDEYDFRPSFQRDPLHWDSFHRFWWQTRCGMSCGCAACGLSVCGYVVLIVLASIDVLNIPGCANTRLVIGLLFLDFLVSACVLWCCLLAWWLRSTRLGCGGYHNERAVLPAPARNPASTEYLRYGPEYNRDAEILEGARLAAYQCLAFAMMSQRRLNADCTAATELRNLSFDVQKMIGDRVWELQPNFIASIASHQADLSGRRLDQCHLSQRRAQELYWRFESEGWSPLSARTGLPSTRQPLFGPGPHRASACPMPAFDYAFWLSRRAELLGKVRAESVGTKCLMKAMPNEPADIVGA